VSKQPEDELKEGISIFGRMCSDLGVACTPTASSRAGSPVQFELAGGGKKVRLILGYDFITDLPGTREFQPALRSYLTAVALRFPEPTSGEYVTVSGIPVAFRINFPFRMSNEGGSFESVHVSTKSGIDAVFEAQFSVRVTDTTAVNIVSLESVITEHLVINAVRNFIDAKHALFYPEGKHPAQLQVVMVESSDYDDKARRFVYHKATDEEIDSFLKRKVYWLGFRRGNQATRVCIADPYDAEYLGVSSERLQQTGAILAADGFLQIDSSGLYACAGTKLLQETRNFNSERASFFFAESQPTGSGRQPSGPPASEAVPLFDVFVSHATEDNAYVEPLVKALEGARIRVWFDKNTLEWGDDLRSGIDRGLTNCRFGIVVFSKAFLRKKKWTEYELNSLFALEKAGRKLILPIWHGITREDLIQYSPTFADRLAKILSATDNYADIIESLLAMLGRTGATKNATATGATEPKQTKSNATTPAQYQATGENARKAEAAGQLESRGNQNQSRNDGLSKVERLMPDLLAEMRTDVAGHPLCREFVALKKGWVFNYPDRAMFTYYYEDHTDLDGKLRILENLGLVRDIRHNDVPRFVMEEKLVDYLVG
jgi:TIR domain